jgi:hypothetical protein
VRRKKLTGAKEGISTDFQDKQSEKIPDPFVLRVKRQA